MRIEVTLHTSDGALRVFRKLQDQHFCRNGILRAFITYKGRIVPVALRNGTWEGGLD